MNDSYMLGFCKTAAAAGLDPAFLVKVAQAVAKTLGEFSEPVFKRVLDKMPQLYQAVANSSVKMNRKVLSELKKVMLAHSKDPEIQRIGAGIKANLLKETLEQRAKSTLGWVEGVWGDMSRRGAGSHHMLRLMKRFNPIQEETAKRLIQVSDTAGGYMPDLARSLIIKVPESREFLKAI